VNVAEHDIQAALDWVCLTLGALDAISDDLLGLLPWGRALVNLRGLDALLRAGQVELTECVLKHELHIFFQCAQYPQLTL
jgi:hypothetical protein